MRVRFNGVVEKRKGGCAPCAKKRGKSRVGKRYVTSKMYTLPSGQSKMFYAGRATEVSDSDGEFLLQYGEFEKE